MRVFKLSILFLTAALFITSCNKYRTVDDVYNQPGYNQSYGIGRAEGGFLNEEDIREARENLDLQAIGGLLERANNAEDFEYLLNSENGINNLDLNDDGYADYISVREFDDRYDDERGFSLYSMFGDNLIQEIATIIFDRNGYDDGYYPGSTVLIRGNDYIYGDNYYYETNWRDRQIPFITWAFDDRNDYYRSPYYYGNYPSYYEQYPIVPTPVYVSRVEQYYYSPVFVQTAQPTVTQVKVVSPYQNQSLSQVYATLPAEKRQVFEAQRNNPKPVNYERVKRENQKFFAENKQFNDNPKNLGRTSSDAPERIKNNQRQEMRETRENMREKWNKPEQQQQQNVQPQNEQKFERQQQKFERQQQKAERQNQPRFEKQNQPQFERPQQQQKIERQQQRFERQQQRVERPQQQQMRQQQQQQRQQMRIERPQQQQMRQQPQQQRPQPQMRQQPNNGGGSNPNKGGGGNPNKGGGNPNKGGGNPNGGGGGKGKGKP